MLIPSLIQHKRDGNAIAADDWARLVADYTAGGIPDYQMSALLMAVVFRGLESQELAALTDAMLESGDRLRFDGFPVPRVDKHSTGGVGDKVSLLLAPMVASCGVAVPMMSGRGLGHTGGTLDKLESIPGMRTGLSLADARARTFTVKVRLDNDLSSGQPLLKAGMLARVTLPVGKPEPQVLVPKDAVVLGQSPTVFVAQNDGGKSVVRPVPVQLGSAHGQWFAVAGDVKAGDPLIVEGNERVRPGQEVRPQTKAIEPPE